MIRHIVFDMGNVLRTFDEEKIIAQYTSKEEEQRQLKESLFTGLWAQLDKGTITHEEVKKEVRKTLPTHLYSVVDRLLDTWHEHMPVDPQMEKLVVQLKDQGYHLYLLSNASVRFSQYEKTTEMFRLFDGLVVSAFHKTVKPEKRIYEILFNTYHLIPSECVFIDDNPANVAAGEDFGMAGHVFDGDISKLLAFFDEMEIVYQE
ncbi:MAG: HAD family phosphatase [Clostridiales bacterium]|nr:HAD family phosphatase [Clostridiales bacterium]